MAALKEEEERGKQADEGGHHVLNPSRQTDDGVSSVQTEEGASSSSSSSSQPSANNGPSRDDVCIPWLFDPSGVTWIPGLALLVGGFTDHAGSAIPMLPILCPLPYPGYIQAHSEENRLQNSGIFAVPMVPMIGPVGGYPPSGFFPVSYNLTQNVIGPGTTAFPAVFQPSQGTIPPQAQEVGAVAPQEVGAVAPLQEGAGPQVPPHAAAQAGQVARQEGERQMVRRFHLAFQIDLLLILKLAVVVFIFNQHGSRDRLLLLVFLAALGYLYQTGALTPLLQRLSRSAQRAMMPPQRRPQHVQAPLAERGQGENPAANVPAAADNDAPGAVGHGEGAAAAGDIGNQAQQQQAAPGRGPTWWNVLKEVQTIVVGFATSLLPGFHQHMD